MGLWLELAYRNMLDSKNIRGAIRYSGAGRLGAAGTPLRVSHAASCNAI